jgi:AGCS family alanine or glycine:cation symporter
MLSLIVTSAFNPAEASGAFVGGTFGYAFLWGMKRALFSCEAGQGSSPIAHCAAKTTEPVREGVVAGLEPFIDTIVVCTLTSLVVLSSGAWNRDGEAVLVDPPAFAATSPGVWDLPDTPLPPKTPAALAISGSDWRVRRQRVPARPLRRRRPRQRHRPPPGHRHRGDGHRREITSPSTGPRSAPRTARSRPRPPPLARGLQGLRRRRAHQPRLRPRHPRPRQVAGRRSPSWLFAVSTMISWAYYGEQGMVYMAGRRSVLPYKIVYCLSIFVACAGIITTEEELDNITAVGTGIMLWVNIPIMLLFGATAMTAYRGYFARLRAGEFDPAPPPSRRPDMCRDRSGHPVRSAARARRHLRAEYRPRAGRGNLPVTFRTCSKSHVATRTHARARARRDHV